VLLARRVADSAGVVDADAVQQGAGDPTIARKTVSKDL
jgi:hypothetical protein